MDDEEDLLIQKGNEDFEGESEKRSIFASLLGFLEFGTIVSCIVILSITDEDCDEPIRLWLFVLIVTLGLHLIFLIFSDIFKSKISTESGFTQGYLAFNTILQSFLFLWMLIGVVWTMNDMEGCESQFYKGFMLTITILLVYFGIISIVLLLVFLIICITCVGSWHISTFLSESEKNKNHNLN